jgi:two-component system KDP operon response regulator KdpE
MNKTHILVVDDELSIIKLLRANLETNGYEVLAAMDGAEALQVIEKEFPDLIILDIMMPKIDGFEVCRRIREWSQIPIIMLSARHDVAEKAKCLNSGADDYITKPFGVNELIARVRAILRRTKEAGTIPTASSFTSGDLKINFGERRVTVAGREVRLTPTEYNLLQALVLNAGKVFPHTALLRRVWGPEYSGEREYLHVFIGRLRKELETDARNPKYIITVPGVGYQFQAVA